MAARGGEDKQRIRFWLTPGKQRLDQSGREVLGADAVVFGGSGSRPAALPIKLDCDRLQLFGDPGAADAPEYHNVVTTGGEGADLVFVMRQHDGFLNVSVKVGNGHNCIVRPAARRKPVLGTPLGAQDLTKVNS